MPISSSVETKHPFYDEHACDWQLVRDAHKGERHIKNQKQKYLSATSGMRQRGIINANQEGAKMYEAYLRRAVFPDMVKPAVNALVGVMHREPADIKLPKALEPMRHNATLDGESLQTLLRCMNEQQILVGRMGLLVDIPEGGRDVVPLLATYQAENIINWDSSRRIDGRKRVDLVVLDESTNERIDRFTWEFVRKFLILDLSTEETTPNSTTPDLVKKNPVYRSQLVTISSNREVHEGQNRQTTVTPFDQPEKALIPTLGGKTLSRIPFVFVGSIDLSPEPDQVPMLGLAQLSITIYRGEADYRHSLFMQGQDTLVIVGIIQDDKSDSNGARLVGAGASIELPIGGDAKYIGVSANGLREQREALMNDRNRSAELGANLLSSAKAGSGREAAESLKIRVAARTASLMSIVKAGGEALEEALKIAAEWIGADPDEVSVIPNTDFIEDEQAVGDLVSLMSAKSMGAPIALQTIHSYMKTKDITSIDFKEEMKLLDEENPAELNRETEDIEETNRLETEEDDDK